MKPKNKSEPETTTEKDTIPTSHDHFGSMMKETLILTFHTQKKKNI